MNPSNPDEMRFNIFAILLFFSVSAWGQGTGMLRGLITDAAIGESDDSSQHQCRQQIGYHNR